MFKNTISDLAQAIDIRLFRVARIRFMQSLNRNTKKSAKYTIS